MLHGSKYHCCLLLERMARKHEADIALRSQAPAVGWQNPSEYAVLLSSVAVLSAFAYWEYRFATSPIMPIDIWKAPSFLPLMLAVVMSFMSVGIVLWYMNAWLQLTRGWSVLHFAIGWVCIAVSPYNYKLTLTGPLNPDTIPLCRSLRSMASVILDPTHVCSVDHSNRPTSYRCIERSDCIYARLSELLAASLPSCGPHGFLSGSSLHRRLHHCEQRRTP